MLPINDFSKVMFYQDDDIVSYKDFLLIAKYLEDKIFRNVELKKVVIVLPEGLSQACLVTFCLQKYEVLPLTTKYLSSEYEPILCDFNPDLVISCADDEAREIKYACHTCNIQLSQLSGLETKLDEIRLNYGKSYLDKSFFNLNQGKLILFTSGTTGRPKQICLTWNNILASVGNICKSYNLTAADVCLNVMPLYHIHGIAACLLSTIYSGGSLILLRCGFDVIKFFNNLEKFSPSWYSAVPTIHQSIISRIITKYDGKITHKLRFIRSSSSALPPKVHTDLIHLFNVPVYQAYGMTEACHQIATQISTKDSEIGSVGFGINVEIAIRDEQENNLPKNSQGLIWIKGENVFSCYTSLSKEASGFSHDGYFNTGDIGYLDKNGTLTIVSRLKEMINKGGEKIAPKEIEDVILTHPLVENAVCFTIEDTYYGENIGLAIVLKTNKKLSEDSIKEYLSNFLSESRLPQAIYFLNELPKGKTGKLQRIGLDKLLKENLENNKPEYTVSINKDEALKLITEIWQDILQISPIKPEDNFFSLGGDSILAIRVINALNSKNLSHKISLAAIFKNQTIASLLESIFSQKTNEIDLIPGLIDSNEEKYQNSHHKAGLSFAQERLWFIEQYEGENSAYHTPLFYKLNSQVSIQALESALTAIVSRHEILHSLIKTDSTGNGYQEISELADLPIIIKQAKLSTQQELCSYFKHEANTAFDLAKEYPIRISIIKETSSNSTYLCIVFHHIAFDGWSKNIFLRDLHEYYNHYTVQSLKNIGTSPKLPKLSIQYKDFAIWQRNYLSSKQLKQQINYWHKKLLGYETLNLPLDKPRPAKINYAGADINFSIDELTSNKLKEAANILHVSLYSLLLSGYYILLSTYANQNDIVIGTPVANRHHHQLEDMIGFFVNILVLRSNVDKNQSLVDYIQATGRNVIEAQLHQDLPFEKLVAELNIMRDTSRHPIFQVMFGLQNFGQTGYNDTQDIILETYQDASLYNAAKFDLTTILDSSFGYIKGTFNYAASLFEESTIQNLIQTYKHILLQISAITKTSQIQLKDISLLNKADYKKLITTGNQTDRLYPENKTIGELFENQVEKTPENIALVYENTQLTYQELNQRANQLAHYLIDNYHIQRNDLIALCLNRSQYMLISILGILKASAAYVPIDPGYPDERISYILKDTNAKVLVTNKTYQSRIGKIIKNNGLTTLIDCCDNKALETYPTTNLKLNISNNNLAYVIYTSGTTGKPKGIMLQHVACINRIMNMIRISKILGNERILFKTNYVFDVSFSDIFTAFLSGATLFVTRNIFDIDEIEANINNNLINICHFTPSQFAIIKSIKGLELFRKLKIIHFSGEALNYNLVKDINKDVCCINYYGPTETGEVTADYVSSNNLTKNSIKIGYPFYNIKLFVLDDNLRTLPIGAIGELYIAGIGLATGYLNLPELTHKLFISNPFQNEEEKKLNRNSRLYKTGDLVRYLPDGNIEYIGRNDFQVKIRGYRIELEEIEAKLSAYPVIRHAAVITQKHKASTTDEADNQYLVGYYVSDSKLNERDIVKYLSKELPEYMIPCAFVWLENLPLTINGKLDRKALPEPEFNNKSDYAAPGNKLEQQVCEVYAEVLGLPVDRVGIKDDFFRLGGNSILAIRLISNLKKQQINLKLADLFVARTAENIVRLSTLSDNKYQPMVKLNNTDNKPLMFMIHPAHAGCEVYTNYAQAISDDYKCYGIDNYNLHHTSKYKSLNSLALYYLNAIEKEFTLQVDSEVILLGWSMGGLISLEIAVMLEQRGYQNIQIYLLDTIIRDKTLNGIFNYRVLKKQLYDSMKDKYDLDYVNKVVDNYEIENKICSDKVSCKLRYAKITLFKAMLPDLYFGLEIGNLLYDYCKNLTYNNVDTLVDNMSQLNIINVKEATHSNIVDIILNQIQIFNIAKI